MTITIEEKAMAYDEAIKVAGELFNSPRTCFDIDQLTEIFPELKESEDERIRGAILIYLDWLDGRKDCQPKGYYTIRDMIAYLEKQKDYELTEDDKKFIPQELIFLCNDLISHRKPLSVDEKGARKIKAFLKSLHRQPHKTKEEWEKQKEQHAKWSSEDWAMLCDIAGYITGTGSSSGISNQERADFLYELPKRFNLQQKPVEWSEEDEDMRDTIIRDLKHLGGDIVNVNPAYKPEIDWLKSLRPQPHWKPSEKQMKALGNCVLGRMPDADARIALEILYDELKKLP